LAKKIQELKKMRLNCKKQADPILGRPAFEATWPRSFYKVVLLEANFVETVEAVLALHVHQVNTIIVAAAHQPAAFG
jgi:hypothetical protein